MTATCWCGGAATRVEDRVVCEESGYHDPTATGRPAVVRRLYIAGPMSGYAECNYPEFHRVAGYLGDEAYEVVNPADFGNGRHYVDLIREDLRMMLDCDGVAVLDGWWESVGARNEVSVAGVLMMPVKSWREWVVEAKADREEARRR